jgi:hypothetical protein
MDNFKNTPNMKIENGVTKIKRFVHQPLTIDHYGVHAKNHENGRVTITKVAANSSDSEDIEYDEVEVSANVIFKIAEALSLTRTVVWVPINEVKEPEEPEKVG